MHGFLRAPDGGSRRSTLRARAQAPPGHHPGDINDLGVIAGYYMDATMCIMVSCALPTAGSPRSMLRARAQAPARAHSPSFLLPHRLGAITGDYVDASNVNHGFVRAPDGSYHQVRRSVRGHRRRPGHLGPGASTREGASREYLLTKTKWVMASCSIPTAVSPRLTFGARAQAPARAPWPKATTQRGESCGQYIDANNVAHGFLRAPTA